MQYLLLMMHFAPKESGIYHVDDQILQLAYIHHVQRFLEVMIREGLSQSSVEVQYGREKVIYPLLKCK